MVSSVNIDDDKEKFINPIANYSTRGRFGNGGGFNPDKFKSNAPSSSRPDYGRKALSKINSYNTPNNGAGIKPMHSVDELAIGMRIEHTKLGIGEITNISAVQGEPSITVDFGIMGVKKLLLKFAKFDILGN